VLSSAQVRTPAPGARLNEEAVTPGMLRKVLKFEAFEGKWCVHDGDKEIDWLGKSQFAPRAFAAHR